MKRRAAVLGSIAACGAATAAHAQEVQWTLSSETSVVGAAIHGAEATTGRRDSGMAEVAIGVRREDVLDNGWVVTVRAEGRAQADAASRAAFAGRLHACDANCSLPVDAPLAASTRLVVGAGEAAADSVAAIEQLSIGLSGPWGEVILGRDVGVAARLDARPPKVARTVAATSPAIDPSGLVIVRARNDVTGPSAKITALSPRWLGLRLGTSVTPEPRARGVDFDPAFTGGRVSAPRLENVWEAGASFSRRFSTPDLRLRVGVTYTAAGLEQTAAGAADYEAVGAGVEAERGSWHGGVRWLSSNNARASGGRYAAVETGVVWSGDAWKFGFEAGHAEDDLLRIEGESWSVSVARRLANEVWMTMGYLDVGADLSAAAPIGAGPDAKAAGAFLELSVRN